MSELIIIIATLTIVIFAWSKVGKGLDWIGVQVGNTGNMLEDITVSGSKQTSRGVAISHGSLKDTVDEQIQKDITRTRAMTKFKKGLSEVELLEIKTSEDFYNTLLAR